MLLSSGAVDQLEVLSIDGIPYTVSSGLGDRYSLPAAGEAS